MRKWVLALAVVLFAVHAQAETAAPAAASIQGHFTGKTLPSMYRDLPAHSFEFQLTADGKITGTLKVEATHVSNECEGTFKESRSTTLNHELAADLNCKAADGSTSAIRFEVRTVSQAEDAKAAFAHGLVAMRYWLISPAASAAEADQIEDMQNTFFTVLAELK